MSLHKIIKDHAGKILLVTTSGKGTVPRELYDMSEYFRHYGAINFQHHKKGNKIISVSTNFRHGSIIASSRSKKEVDKNIRDAILTSFDLPSAWEAEAKLRRVGAKAEEYVLA